ncbi:hypothetical protein [Phytoactinopolyspora mesophila]|uniref:Uncharacterized protein n=1 Tax=Phytoactinopolyspora mesophila TaxID=2650750 RepID=A0A7K3M374_9ACTN|nr:hypothetical protein [Phytoactinopolyspora mesophila]NDL57696.1 hypothetical protein [Phytoactinopolyspora mesophila]
MLRTALRTSSALLLTSLLIAGCGSDDGSGDDGPVDSGDVTTDDGADDDADDGADDGADDDADDGADDGADDDADDDTLAGVDIPDGWTLVTDEPSGISVALPDAVAPQEQEAPTGDGGTMTARSFFMVEGDVEVGFNVLDLDGGMYDLEVGMQGVADQIAGTVERSESITVDGNEGIEAEVSFGADYVTTFQLIELDDHVLQPLVSSEQQNSGQAEEYFEQITNSIELG